MAVRYRRQVIAVRLPHPAHKFRPPNMALTAEPTYGEKCLVGWIVDGEFSATSPSISLTTSNDEHTVKALLRRRGDFNDDGRVDLLDFSTFALCFGLTAPAGDCGPEEFACADLDQNGWINLSDFSTFAVNFTGPGG